MSDYVNGTNLKNLLRTSVYNNGWTLEAILNELIDNAHDAMDKIHLNDVEKSELKLTIALDKQKKQLIITDQGIGMNDKGINTSITLYGTSKTDLSENTGRFGIGGITALGYLTDIDNSVQIISKPINNRNVYQTTIDFKDIMSSGRHEPNATPAEIDVYDLYKSYMGDSCGTVIIINLSLDKFEKLHKMLGLEENDLNTPDFKSDYLVEYLPYLYENKVFPYEIIMKVIDGSTSFSEPLNTEIIRMQPALNRNDVSFKEYNVKICKTDDGKFDLCTPDEPHECIETRTTKIKKNNVPVHDQVITFQIGCCETTSGIYVRRNGRTVTRILVPQPNAGTMAERPIYCKSTFIISYQADIVLDDIFCVEMNKGRVNTNGSTESSFYPNMKKVINRTCKKHIVPLKAPSNPPPMVSSENEEDNDNSSQEYSGKKEKKSRSSKKSFKDYIIKCTASPSNEIQVYKGDTLIKTLYFPMGHSIASSMRDTIIALGTEQTDTQFMNTLECLHCATLPHKQS